MSANRVSRLLVVGIFSCLNICGVIALAQNNPAPLLNQPSVPTTVVPGGAAFTLTANGTGFVSGSLVQWNGLSLATQFVSASQLTATVPASDIGTAGTASVTISSPAPGGGVSNAQFVFITNSRPGVDLQQLLGNLGENFTESVAVGDFNGDGKPDVAITNLLQNTVSIQLGNGDGTFGSPVGYATGANPFFVAAGDFNHDGKLDLAVTDTGQNAVSVLLGNGDGTFQSHVDYDVGTLGDTQMSIAVADFNNDGNVDMAVANDLSGSVSILLGNGDGTFQPQLTFNTVEPGPLAVGDYNGDGKLDLAVAGGDGILIWLGNGDGTFSEGTVVVDRVILAGIVPADLNGDGKLDLAAVNQQQSLYVALGNGDGTFQVPVTYATANTPSSLTVADFNGDGKLDVAVSTFTSAISVLLGNGDGTFQAHVDQGGPGVSSIVAVDLNNDGIADVVTNQIALLGTTAELSPYMLNFGNVEVGTTSSPQSVTVTNLGGTTLTVSNITASPQFAQTNNCSSLPSGGSCTINVTFAPDGAGNQGGSLMVTDNAVGSPQSVALSGFGTQPAVTLSPGPLTFRQQLVGTIASQKELLYNTGSANLTISNISVSGQFGERNNCAPTLVPGQSCAITVEFKPFNPGLFTGTLSISDNAPGSPQTAALTGTGTAFTVSPLNLNFGSIVIGQTSAPQTVTITNAAKTTQKIVKIAILNGVGSKEFAQTNNCGSSLAAGASCTVNVTFSPTNKGTVGATLQVMGGGGTFDVSLNGTGTN